MPNEHNIWEFANKLLNVVTKDIRAGKGGTLVGVIIAYVAGAVYGFPKDSATFTLIIMYVIFGCGILPAISLIFIKFDHRRSKRRRTSRYHY